MWQNENSPVGPALGLILIYVGPKLDPVGMREFLKITRIGFDARKYVT